MNNKKLGSLFFYQRKVLLEYFFICKLYLKNSVKLTKKKIAGARVKIFLGTWISNFCYKCQVEEFHDDCSLLTKWLFVKILEKNYCCT